MNFKREKRGQTTVAIKVTIYLDSFEADFCS